MEPFEYLISSPKFLSKAKKLRGRSEKLSYFKVVAISQLVRETTEHFINNRVSILNGKFEESLLDGIPSKDGLRHFKKQTEKHVYTDERVLSVEVAGFSIIYQLLDRFGEAAVEDFENRAAGKEPSAESRKVLGLMPIQYRRPGGSRIKRPYDLLLSVTDFVAGMTDGYAVNLYQKITGQKFVT